MKRLKSSYPSAAAAAHSSSSSSSGIPSPELPFHHRDPRPPLCKAAAASYSTNNNNNNNNNNKPPKIRIIHIFAPEIIKTDVANFRELVQRLTGKPTHCDRTWTSNNNQRGKTTKRSKPHNPPPPSESQQYDRQRREVEESKGGGATTFSFSTYSHEETRTSNDGSGSGSGSVTVSYTDNGLFGTSSGGFDFGVLAGKDNGMVVKEEADQVLYGDNEERNHMPWVGNGNGNDERLGCGYFGEIDGFIQELGGDDFPFMEPPSDYHYRHLPHLHALQGELVTQQHFA